MSIMLSIFLYIGGTLDVWEGVWHHGWVLPGRERISEFFCKQLASSSVGCNDYVELNLTEWSDTELQVTSTG